MILIDIFAGIVSRVSARLTPSLSEYDETIVGVNYMYGPIKQVVTELQTWTENPDYSKKKYPIVCLIQPFEETINPSNGVNTLALPRIIIGRQSEASWNTSERYANNFRPVLYPIYETLLDEMDNEKRIEATQGNGFSHTKIDWPYWDDSKDSNPFSDRLDIIEIKNLKINIINNC